MKTFRIFLLMALFANVFLLFSCKKTDIAAPPTIKIFVNNVDITDKPVFKCLSGSRVEYRFDISANSTIADIKSVIFDVIDPDTKVPQEILVGGLTQSLTESVAGVIFPIDAVEVSITVKDMDGNEIFKKFVINVEY